MILSGCQVNQIILIDPNEKPCSFFAKAEKEYLEIFILDSGRQEVQSIDSSKAATDRAKGCTSEKAVCTKMQYKPKHVRGRGRGAYGHYENAAD